MLFNNQQLSEYLSYLYGHVVQGTFVGLHRYRVFQKNSKVYYGCITFIEKNGVETSDYYEISHEKISKFFEKRY